MQNFILFYANCNASHVLTRFEHVPEKHAYLKTVLQPAIVEVLNARVAAAESLAIPIYKSLNIKERIRTAALQFKDKQSTAIRNELAKKAELAGLERNRINQLMALVDKKDKDIAAYRASKQNLGMASAFNIETGKNPNQIRREFSKDLVGLVSKTEFANIFAEQFKPMALKKAKNELQAILDTYKQLSDDQMRLVRKRVFQFYMDETVISAYYSYNKSILKQKLSGLRYHYEKAYRDLMAGFDINIEPSTKAKRNTYQY